MKCNRDCFNCKRPDCNVSDDLDNPARCKRWYERHKEQKRAYQREYIRRKRALAKAEEVAV